MLVAVTEAGKRIVSFKTTDEDKKTKFYCPVCGEEVILKRGKHKIPHFAHKVKSDCTNGEGETREHLEVKQWLYNYFRSRGIYAVLESTKWGKDIRPDVAAYIKGRWVGFEVQRSNISEDAIDSRIERNNDHGISVMWILTESFYKNAKHGGRFRMRAQDKYLMQLNYGTLFVYGNNALHAMKAQKAESWIPLTDFGGGYYKTLKATYYCTHDSEIDLLNDCLPQRHEAYENKHCCLPECTLYGLNYNKSKNLDEIPNHYYSTDYRGG